MNIGDKIKNIRKRLFLNEEKMSELLKISKKDLIKIENSVPNTSSEILNKVLETLNLKETDLSNNTKISIEKKIDMKKYPNVFKAYSEILKYYFPKPCQIFVLTKIKQQNKFKSIFNLFFCNNKASIINEMNTFTPSYLIKRDDDYLLVNIKESTLSISEVEFIKDENYFLHDGYKYKKANEIILK